jgi:hypothetical protein
LYALLGVATVKKRPWRFPPPPPAWRRDVKRQTSPVRLATRSPRPAPGQLSIDDVSGVDPDVPKSGDKDNEAA